MVKNKQNKLGLSCDKLSLGYNLEFFYLFPRTPLVCGDLICFLQIIVGIDIC